MSTRFPPARENDLIVSAANFSTKITASPTTYGLTSGQATAFAADLASFVSAHTIANDPLTRSHANIIAKDAAKHDLLVSYRQLAGIVQRFPGTTNFTRAELGIPMRDSEPSPVPPPASAPLVAIKSAIGRTLRIRLIDTANPTRRGKPAGVSGAAVFSHVGASAPADLSDWKFEGNTGRTGVAIAFPPAIANGATVWVTAYWFNPRKQAGPNSDPVAANLPGGGVSLAA